jgi:hypothetical protein
MFTHPLRLDHASGPNKKVQLMSKTAMPTAKLLKKNVFEDDARARREKRFEREALIEQNRQTVPIHQHFPVSGSSGGALGARIQGMRYQNTPWSHVNEPVPDAVR